MSIFLHSSSEGNKLERELKSFVDIANEVSCEDVSRSMDEYGLSFDKNYFVAKKEVRPEYCCDVRSCTCVLIDS